MYVQTRELACRAGALCAGGWRTVLAASLLCVLALGAAQAQTADEGTAKAIDEYMKTASGSGFFMGAVLVSKGGQVLISKGYEMANLEDAVPNTPQSRFNLASVAKTFASTMILLLEERGKLRLQDPICKYLEDCPEAWREVTVSHLLNHTSGIMNYTELPDQFETRALASFLPDAINRIRKMPLQFKPGTEFRYSNTGYKLLHDIIERVSGKTYEVFLQENILDPLGMKNTGVLEKPGIRHVIIKGRAAGYTDGIGPLENAPWVHPSYAGGFGIYSTVEDMNLWGQSWFSDKLLSKRTRELAWTAGKGNYGYGWYVFDRAKHRFVMHGGNIPGYGLTFAIYPDDQVVIVVASNLDTAPTPRIHDDVAKIVFGESYTPLPRWKAVAVDPKIYDDYVGRYQKVDEPGFTITITKENGLLWDRVGDSPGAATMVLRPLSETKFYNKMFVLYEATFVKDEHGAVTALIAEGSWGRNEFKKIK